MSSLLQGDAIMSAVTNSGSTGYQPKWLYQERSWGGGGRILSYKTGNCDCLCDVSLSDLSGHFQIHNKKSYPVRVYGIRVFSSTELTVEQLKEYLTIFVKAMDDEGNGDKQLAPLRANGIRFEYNAHYGA